MQKAFQSVETHPLNLIPVMRAEGREVQLDIDPDIRAVIEPELMPGEKLLWADRPHKFPFSFGNLYMLCFSIVWMALLLGLFVPAGIAAILGEPSVETGSEVTGNVAFGFGFLAFISVFILVGIGMLLYAIKAFIGPSRETYAITSLRGIIISTFFGRRVTSLSPGKLRNYEKMDKGGLGSLHFRLDSNVLSSYSNFPLGHQLNTFHNIKNLKNVEYLIYRTFPREEQPHE